ncbi:MAG: hypothetical protein JWO36_1051 [Myxococcales bacterium]|nr:hypothetical protein [Myxococcales bacterium]
MLTRLGAETLVHHAEADSDLDRFLFQPTVTVTDYQTYLGRVYGTLVPLEAALATTPGLADVIDVRARTKSSFVLRDLSKLGVPRQDIVSLPVCTSIPVLRSPAAALGWLYVVERPLLASSVILRHLEMQLPTDMTGAASYLSCYAGQTGSMWRALGVAMDRVATSLTVGDAIVAAAHDAFRTLQRWRTYNLQRQIGIRRAV